MYWKPRSVPIAVTGKGDARAAASFCDWMKERLDSTLRNSSEGAIEV